MVCFPEVWAPKPLSISTSISSALIGIVAFVGNLMILIVVVKDPLKKLHTPFNYFLVNLAVSDIIVGGFTMPLITYIHYMEATGYMPSAFIKTVQISFFISITASLLSLIALSVDRYIAIAWSIKYRQYLSWQRCIIVSVCIWIFSLSFPFIYFYSGFIDFLMIYACVTILTGLVVIIVIYLRVYVFLRRHTIQLKTQQRASSTAADEFHLKRLLMEKKVTRAFLVILFAFVATNIPATVMIFILQFCKGWNCTVLHVLRDMQVLLLPLNSCVNPFICTIRLKHFRQSIKYLFCARLNQIRSLRSSNQTSDTKL